jgi:hypothetical protein
MCERDSCWLHACPADSARQAALNAGAEVVVRHGPGWPVGSSDWAPASGAVVSTSAQRLSVAPLLAASRLSAQRPPWQLSGCQVARLPGCQAGVLPHAWLPLGFGRPFAAWGAGWAMGRRAQHPCVADLIDGQQLHAGSATWASAGRRLPRYKVAWQAAGVRALC